MVSSALGTACESTTSRDTKRRPATDSESSWTTVSDLTVTNAGDRLNDTNSLALDVPVNQDVSYQQNIRQTAAQEAEAETHLNSSLWQR